MLKQAESEITPCVWRVLKHLWTHLAGEGCWNRQNLRLHLACEECWNTCEHIWQVKNAETGRIWGYHAMCAKNAETGTIGSYHTLLKQAKSEITTPCMWKMLKQAESEVTTRHTFHVKNTETGRIWNYHTLCLKNAGKPRSTNVACEECLMLNRWNLRSPCLSVFFFALAWERTFIKTYTLNVDVL